jgi:transposase
MRVEAVRAGGDDALHAIAIEQGDVLQRLHLEEEFVAGAPGGVAGAAFLLARAPRISRLAAFRMRTKALVILRARSSNDPAQPTQNSTSGTSPVAAKEDIVGTCVLIGNDE